MDLTYYTHDQVSKIILNYIKHEFEFPVRILFREYVQILVFQNAKSSISRIWLQGML